METKKRIRKPHRRQVKVKPMTEEQRKEYESDQKYYAIGARCLERGR